MNRAEKAEFIEDVRGAFAASPFVVLTDFKGATVLELDALRRACEANGAQFRVVKNTLCRIAVADTEKSALAAHFRGNIGVVLAGDDVVSVAKMIRDQKRANDKIAIRAGFFDGDVLDEKGVASVADLPSREELLSKLLATLNEGPRQLLSVIQGPARDLLYVLNNFASKLEDGGK